MIYIPYKPTQRFSDSRIKVKSLKKSEIVSKLKLWEDKFIKVNPEGMYNWDDYNSNPCRNHDLIVSSNMDFVNKIIIR